MQLIYWPFFAFLVIIATEISMGDTFHRRSLPAAKCQEIRRTQFVRSTQRTTIYCPPPPPAPICPNLDYELEFPQPPQRAGCPPPPPAKKCKTTTTTTTTTTRRPQQSSAKESDSTDTFLSNFYKYISQTVMNTASSIVNSFSRSVFG